MFAQGKSSGSGPWSPIASFRSGLVDHRMARRSLINEFRRGRLGREDICDAHPELMRAARGVGRRTETVCPICTEDNLVLVTYVFGPRLPSHGKVVADNAELAQFHRRREEYAAYVVEACCSCRWHHLVRVLPIGGQRTARRVG
ncbi:MAG: DUF5318 family protein [Actinomycetota bacterium]